LFPYAPHPSLWFARLRTGTSPKSLISHAGVVAGILLAVGPTSAQEVKPAPPLDPPVTNSSTTPLLVAAGSKPERAKTEEKPEADSDGKMPPSKTAVHVAWLLQTWYGNAFGDTFGGALPGRATPQGRNYGMKGNDDFRFRRARVALTGNPADNLDYRFMFDLAAPNFSQDAWVGYQLGRHARIEVGRQKTGMSEEGSRPDDQLLTISRSVMNEDLPVKGGRVGDARSTGAALRFNFTGVRGFVGAWNDLGDTNGLTFAGNGKFIDGAVYVDVVQHLTLGIWGGRIAGGNGDQEDRERAGATLLYRNGRLFFEGEVAYTRDYAAGAPAPGKNGSIGRGGYLLAGYRFSPQWQVVGRYDNWDPAKQTVFTGIATTESGVAIPKSNHKLHEYTLGVNYTVPHHDARLQLNYVREDSENNGGVFFGTPRTIVLVGVQLGYDSPRVSNAEPEKYDLHESVHPKSYAMQNTIRAGMLASPRLGLALGADFGLPKAHLLPSAETRISADLLAPFDVPSFLGLPTTQSTVTLDQVFAAHPHSLGLYGGFGLGGYFGAKFRPGGKLFLGYNLTNTLGLELTSHFTGLPDPRYTLQVRFPL